ncbi:class I SAM-dependent methyltransferase [Streptomyces gardneri]|nr:class I SAM-dependent methyltransferase [Streptomyces gardneri]
MRTEGDSWDIVSSVGVTALGVAAARALESGQPDPLVRDDFAAMFVSASGHEGLQHLLDNPAAAAKSPLMLGAIGLRTKFFDNFCVSATVAGVRQAVILAAGLDARSFRLPWPPDTVVFEVDQPKVLDFKRQVLTDNDAVAGVDRREIPTDLRDDWPAALLAGGFDPAAPTAWIAEGLLPYLPGTAQDLLFERIHRLSAPGSRAACDMITDFDPLDRFADSRGDDLKDTLFRDNDPMNLIYTDDRTNPDVWFAAHEWSTDSTSSQELAARFGRPIAELPEALALIMSITRYVTASWPPA